MREDGSDGTIACTIRTLGDSGTVGTAAAHAIENEHFIPINQRI